MDLMNPNIHSAGALEQGPQAMRSQSDTEGALMPVLEAEDMCILRHGLSLEYGRGLDRETCRKLN